jgi:hypothetical protein
MQTHRRELHDVLTFAQALVYFALIGTGTVAIALAAHLR